MYLVVKVAKSPHSEKLFTALHYNKLSHPFFLEMPFNFKCKNDTTLTYKQIYNLEKRSQNHNQ